tara:strand:- start:211 stop:402 length:192 start_codon:yes stop_codon:yes gene_type:complete
MGLTTQEALKFGELALKKANIVNYKNEAREILENLLKKNTRGTFFNKREEYKRNEQRGFHKKN